MLKVIIIAVIFVVFFDAVPIWGWVIAAFLYDYFGNYESAIEDQEDTHQTVQEYRDYERYRVRDEDQARYY